MNNLLGRKITLEAHKKKNNNISFQKIIASIIGVLLTGIITWGSTRYFKILNGNDRESIVFEDKDICLLFPEYAPYCGYIRKNNENLDYMLHRDLLLHNRNIEPCKCSCQPINITCNNSSSSVASPIIIYKNITIPSEPKVIYKNITQTSAPKIIYKDVICPIVTCPTCPNVNNVCGKLGYILYDECKKKLNETTKINPHQLLGNRNNLNQSLLLRKIGILECGDLIQHDNIHYIKPYSSNCTNKYCGIQIYSDKKYIIYISDDIIKRLDNKKLYFKFECKEETIVKIFQSKEINKCQLLYAILLKIIRAYEIYFDEQIFIYNNNVRYYADLSPHLIFDENIRINNTLNSSTTHFKLYDKHDLILQRYINFTQSKLFGNYGEKYALYNPIKEYIEALKIHILTKICTP
ncbi:hypothetical protein PV326_013431 [Microctonus aethiopoides]|nr:hypothetical protein PV326_013431 [Microctonus aethiopoides]